MSTPFLIGFCEAFLGRLIQEGDLEIVPGSQGLLVEEVAAGLGAAREGQQVLATVTALLFKSAHVEELWADTDRMKQVMESLRP